MSGRRRSSKPLSSTRRQERSATGRSSCTQHMTPYEFGTRSEANWRFSAGKFFAFILGLHLKARLWHSQGLAAYMPYRFGPGRPPPSPPISQNLDNAGLILQNLENKEFIGKILIRLDLWVVFAQNIDSRGVILTG